MFELVESTLHDVFKIENEGIVFLGCGGDINKWAEDARTFLLEEKAITTMDAFPTAYRFTLPPSNFSDEELICLYFKFPDNMSTINLGRLAILRLMIDGCKWFSDFKTMVKKSSRL